MRWHGWWARSNAWGISDEASLGDHALVIAEITAAMLESIFTVPGPLHDGAVIISQEKIAAAALKEEEDDD